MESELLQRIAALEDKTEKIYVSVEKTRRYFFWTMIISIAVVVLPAIGLVFAIPFFLNSYVAPMQSLLQ